ncbi:putative uncharacterized protein DDB_G0289963 [Belonocnema kinseyi]|uniref:putative uncharacterized protein DDB_G0289963 n=1 Tax=Belonocnema kinseyi TaxID=2817044 RepID=UPI00143D1390|nr:putative uncharacterized protein DDB_G0289963 [Belonocnema kinseyi]
MNSEAGASHVRKQSFQEDEYRAFRIALDVKETEIGDFWKNIDELKSKEVFLRIPEGLHSKIMRKKNTLKDKNSNYDEKGSRVTNAKTERRTSSKTGENKKKIVGPDDMKENVPLTRKKDSELKEKTSGAVKKKINEKKMKKVDQCHTSVTIATNTIHLSTDDVGKKVRKSKNTRVLAAKENLPTSQETEKMMKEAAVKRVKRNIKISENVSNNVTNNSGEEFNGKNEDPKPKSKRQNQLKEKKNAMKQKENVQAKGKSSTDLDVKENALPKEKESEKKRRVSKRKKGDFIGNKTHLRKLGPCKRNEEKSKNVSLIDEKDVGEKEAKPKVKKTRAKKTVLLKEGEEKTSEPEIKGNAGMEGNKKTVNEKSKNKRNKADVDNNTKNDADKKKQNKSKKSENSKIGESASKEVTKNIESENELMKTNNSEAHSEIPINLKPINYNSREVKNFPLNVDNKRKDLSSDKRLECTEFFEPITLGNIDQTIFEKLNLVNNDLKNEDFDFQDKSFEKPSLKEVMESPYLFDEENHDSEDHQPPEDLKKSSATVFEETFKKPERKKTLYELKQEVKQKIREVRHEKKVAKAVEKLSLYTLKHLKKLDSNPVIKLHRKFFKFSLVFLFIPLTFFLNLVLQAETLFPIKQKTTNLLIVTNFSLQTLRRKFGLLNNIKTHLGKYEILKKIFFSSWSEIYFIFYDALKNYFVSNKNNFS